MTEMPQEIREALNHILNYFVDEYKHFELYCEEITEKPFDLDEWNGDLELIPEEARDHVFFHALTIEQWIKKQNEPIPDNELLHEHLMKNHFKK